MSSIKISDFAGQIGIGSSRLLKQLSDAGILGKTESDSLRDDEKRQLLDFLRGEVIAPVRLPVNERGKITLKKQTKHEIERPSKNGTPPKKVLVQTTKNRTFVKREQLEKIEEREALVELAKAKEHIGSLKKKLDKAEENLRLAQDKTLDIEAVKTSNEDIDVRRPTVFISYSYDSPSHKAWVKEFSSALVKNGIETMLDQWTLHPGDSLTEFMEKGISEANFVLIICTEKYKEKSDTRVGGVGYEEAIISNDILSGSNQRKYIPVLKSENRKAAMPIALASKVFLDFSNTEIEGEELTDLLLTLYGRRPVAPQLGEVPDFKRLSEKSSP